jgi:DNA-binding response OmpR family regulator
MKAKKRILVINGHEGTARVLQRVLEREGYEVITAFDGVTGLHRARDDTPDLIILDVTTPDMSGYEVCHHLQLAPNTRHIPVLMLADKGRVDEDFRGVSRRVEQQMAGFDAGALEFLTVLSHNPCENMSPNLCENQAGRECG